MDVYFVVYKIETGDWYESEFGCKTRASAEKMADQYRAKGYEAIVISRGWPPSKD